MTAIIATENEKPLERVTAPGLLVMKQQGIPIVSVTAYDYPSARIADRAGVDIVLVGDTLGIMALGYKNTVPVTLEEMIHHSKAAKRGVRRALVLVDMPFGTYQASPEDALRNAVRLMKEGGAHAVKLEGGENITPAIRLLTQAGIPVVGHIGLTPQSIHALGGHKIQGRTPDAAEQILSAAVALEEAGACAIVLEAIPASLARQITTSLAIPTIGIGAGAECDGQVQVWHDLFGIHPGKRLRHAKRYAELGEIMEEALRLYADEVRHHEFPTEENSH